MEDPAPPVRHVCFGVFDVDLQTGELRRKGIRIRLQEQPFQILRMLLEHRGEVVPRDDIEKGSGRRIHSLTSITVSTEL
jgi:DNA-binding winged helix-turn-helix (wHTH) protein